MDTVRDVLQDMIKIYGLWFKMNRLTCLLHLLGLKTIIVYFLYFLTHSTAVDAKRKSNISDLAIFEEHEYCGKSGCQFHCRYPLMLTGIYIARIHFLLLDYKNRGSNFRNHATTIISQASGQRP